MIAKNFHQLELTQGEFSRLSESSGGTPYRIMNYIPLIHTFLTHFPQLRTIELSENVVANLPSSVREPAREDTVNYRKVMKNIVENLWTLFAPALLDGVLEAMGKLRASRDRTFELEYCLAPIGVRYMSPGIRDALEHITFLSLKYSNADTRDEDSDPPKGMTSFIASARNLKRLHLNLCEYVSSEHVFKKGATWPHLKEV